MSQKRVAPHTEKLSTSLVQAQKRFAEWRRRRPPRSRIPEALWSAAVSLARTQGHHRTARALGLNYYALQKRMKKKDTAGPAKSPGAEFVEWRPTEMPGGRLECTIELEDGRGAKRRMAIHGIRMPDLAALTRSFWREGA